MAERFQDEQERIGLMMKRAAKLLRLGDELMKKTLETAQGAENFVLILNQVVSNKSRIVCLAHALCYNPYQNSFYYTQFAKAVQSDITNLEQREVQPQEQQDNREAPEQAAPSAAGQEVAPSDVALVDKLVNQLKKDCVEAPSFENPSYHALLVEQIVDAIEERYPKSIEDLKKKHKQSYIRHLGENMS